MLLFACACLLFVLTELMLALLLCFECRLFFPSPIPSALVSILVRVAFAAVFALKADGGWAVVCGDDRPDLSISVDKRFNEPPLEPHPFNIPFFWPATGGGLLGDGEERRAGGGIVSVKA